MKELNNHPFMDCRTVKAWETAAGGFIQVTDVRDFCYGQYSVEIKVQGGMENVFASTNLDVCIAWAIHYAENH